MPWRTPPSLSTLQTRKRCLLLEADIHRNNIRQDWADIKGSFQRGREAATAKAEAVKPWLATASFLLAGFSAYRRLRHQGGGKSQGKGSFWSKLLVTGTSVASIARFLLRLRSR